jgi:hypothetical protein
MRRQEVVATRRGLAVGGAIVAGVGAVIAVALITSGGSTREHSVRRASQAAVISGPQIEAKLVQEVGSKTGEPISSFSCPDRQVAPGQTINCEAAFSSGGRQRIAVTVRGSKGNVQLEVGLR